VYAVAPVSAPTSNTMSPTRSAVARPQPVVRDDPNAHRIDDRVVTVAGIEMDLAPTVGHPKQLP